MISQGPGFSVLYRWRIRPGMEAAFIEAWTEVSHDLKRKGSLGSRLHRGPEGLWYSYAQWPSAEARTAAFELPSGAPAASAAMQEAIAERLPEIVLESVSDLMVAPSEPTAAPDSRNEYLLLMHDDVPPAGAGGSEGAEGAAWERYLTKLHASGAFEGGSSIGRGVCVRKLGDPHAPLGVTGFLRVRAESLEAALRHLEGNPDFEAGGTVEVRELLRD